MEMPSARNQGNGLPQKQQQQQSSLHKRSSCCLEAPVVDEDRTSGSAETGIGFLIHSSLRLLGHALKHDELTRDVAPSVLSRGDPPVLVVGDTSSDEVDRRAARQSHRP
jgi:hypothetical protein